MYYAFEPSDPEDPNSDPVVHEFKTKEEAEYHSPFVVSKEQYESWSNEIKKVYENHSSKSTYHLRRLTNG